VMPHITVCICTFRRPRLLKALLEKLQEQETKGLFTFSVVVADNDSLESGKPTVQEFAILSRIPITYCVQPAQNIALTRNKAIEHTTGDFVAFIDDDELPIKNWLLTLFEAFHKYKVDGVLGPVKPQYEVEAPRWVVKGGFYDRPSYRTGFVIDWRKGRTGNVLLNRKLFLTNEQPFRPDFLTGEDQDFFRRMIDKGHVFVWCHEAMAYEVVPASRWNRSFMLKRALLRGRISLLHGTSRRAEILKSVVAVPAYAMALPFLFMAGQHHFMKYLIKTFDHAGRLLAWLGINPVNEQYITE